MRFGSEEFIFQPMDEDVAVVPSNEEKFGDIIGGNVKMREIYGILEKIAPTNATVVIEGETGTGKEVALVGDDEGVFGIAAGKAVRDLLTASRTDEGHRGDVERSDLTDMQVLDVAHNSFLCECGCS